MASNLANLGNSLIGPVTHVCEKLYTKTCCTKMINEFNFQDQECLKLVATKSIGYGIVVGASLVKLPQVTKIFNAKSGIGISLFGVILELLAITFNAGYSFRNGFPFSAWGEAIFLAIETAMIAFLVLWYNGSKVGAIAFLMTYMGQFFALTQPTLVSMNLMWWLQSSVLPLAVTGKLLQSYKNYKAGHTGQLSAISALAIFAGSLTRIMTTIQETGDMLTAVTFASAAAANGILAFQVMYYRQSTRKFLEKGKKKKAN